MSKWPVGLDRFMSASLTRRSLLARGVGTAVAATGVWLFPISFGPSVRRIPRAMAAQCGSLSPPPGSSCDPCVFYDCAVDCDCCYSPYGRIDEYNHCSAICFDPFVGPDGFPVDCSYDFVLYGCGSCEPYCPDSTYLGSC